MNTFHKYFQRRLSNFILHLMFVDFKIIFLIYFSLFKDFRAFLEFSDPILFEFKMFVYDILFTDTISIQQTIEYLCIRIILMVIDSNM